MSNNYIKKLYNVIDLIKVNHPCFKVKHPGEYIDNFIKNVLENYKLENKYDF